MERAKCDRKEEMNGFTEFVFCRLQVWDIVRLPTACMTAGRKMRGLMTNN
jgi:hypothetical protein